MIRIELVLTVSSDSVIMEKSVDVHIQTRSSTWLIAISLNFVHCIKVYDMNLKDKVEWLKTHFFSDFVLTRERVFNELSDKQSMFCVCGKLATGLHESSCRKFNKVVDAETVKRLNHLIAINNEKTE